MADGGWQKSEKRDERRKLTKANPSFSVKLGKTQASVNQCVLPLASVMGWD